MADAETAATIGRLGEVACEGAADADGWELTPQQERELAASLRAYDREQRWAAFRMLWGRPVVNVWSTERRTDGVIDYVRNRSEEWTLWRAIIATLALILSRYHGQREVERYCARTGRLYIPRRDLGFWDSRADSGGYGYGYLELYPRCRVSVGWDGESTW
ncbi:hypothetical protein D9602_02960 [Sphingomonas sp. TX0522]|nr:hypothetical protein [Sphingomonas sp. TX0522]